jgi:D-glucuronyl C5-epimerase C-terminus
VQFRPDGSNQPLPQFLVPDGELPADAVAATAALTAAQKTATGTTRADLVYVQALGTKFAGARFAGRRATIDRILRLNAWWYARRTAPAGRVLVRDPQGLIYSYAPGHGFAFNPVGTAGRWQRLNEGFTAVQLAATLLELGVADNRGGRETLNWEYYDVPDEPAAIRPGVSAMAQARISQLFANAYRASGDPRFATASADAMASMAIDVSVGGSRSMVAYPDGSVTAPWFVERAYPGADPWKGAALNGFMVSLIELRSAERALREPAPGPAAIGDAAANEAKRLADEGAATLDRYLPAHDTGRWSYYGMLTPGRAFRTHVANATYHCYHVSLLRTLAPMYPALRFGAYAETWAAYAVKAGAKCPDAGSPTG